MKKIALAALAALTLLGSSASAESYKELEESYISDCKALVSDLESTNDQNKVCNCSLILSQEGLFNKNLLYKLNEQEANIAVDSFNKNTMVCVVKFFHDALGFLQRGLDLSFSFFYKNSKKDFKFKKKSI